MYNHMIGRAASVVSPFHFLLLGTTLYAVRLHELAHFRDLTSIFDLRVCKRNLKRPSLQRGETLYYNGNLETLG